jgi:hypothetical protein
MLRASAWLQCATPAYAGIENVISHAGESIHQEPAVQRRLRFHVGECRSRLTYLRADTGANRVPPRRRGWSTRTLFHVR